MNADHSAQLRLLDLQAVDTALAQLAHRRRTLPELAALADRHRQADGVGLELLDAQTAASDVEAEQERLDKEIELVRARATRDQQRMQAGGLPGKELESLQHEVATLARRQSSLEDDLLEVMEQAETAEAGVAKLTAQRDALAVEIADLTTARDRSAAEIDTSVSSRSEERQAIAADLPADLRAMYEKAREHGGGSGAAMLRQRRCEGCRIELSGSELSAMRAAAPETVMRCDNCRRILVRTAESGL